MRKYETPEIDLQIEPTYLEHAQKVVVSLTAGTWRKDYKSEDGTATVVKTGHVFIKPTQEDTGSIEVPANTMVKVQVSILNESGARLVSDEAKIPLLWTAYDEVIE